MEHGIEKTMNMKLIICTFDQLFDFKINFHKSEIFYFGEAKDVKEHYLQLFGWEGGRFPLLLPLWKLTRKEWKNVEIFCEKNVFFR
jgi:hypothetical protein